MYRDYYLGAVDPHELPRNSDPVFGFHSLGTATGGCWPKVEAAEAESEEEGRVEEEGTGKKKKQNIFHVNFFRIFVLLFCCCSAAVNPFFVSMMLMLYLPVLLFLLLLSLLTFVACYCL